MNKIDNIKLGCKCCDSFPTNSPCLVKDLIFTHPNDLLNYECRCKCPNTINCENGFLQAFSSKNDFSDCCKCKEICENGIAPYNYYNLNTKILEPCKCCPIRPGHNMILNGYPECWKCISCGINMISVPYPKCCECLKFCPNTNYAPYGPDCICCTNFPCMNDKM